MPHALQVSFRQLVPNESLIALAREKYRQIRCARPTLGECLVQLEQRSGVLTHATVRMRDEGRIGAEAEASHRDPQAALCMALQLAQAQLGVRLDKTFPDESLRRAG
jgi:hypothetical protein